MFMLMSNILEVFMKNCDFILEKVMKEKGFTQEALAEMLGIKIPNISRWINGHVCPTIDTVAKICKCLNCTPNDLIVLT